MPGDGAQLARRRLRVAAVLDEHVERLHHAGADAGGGERVAAGDRGRRVPGKFFSCASFAFSCDAEPGEHGDDRERRLPRPRPGAVARSAPSGPTAPSSGWPRSMSRFGITRTLLIRVPSTASSAGSSVIEASTETAGISMPPMPIERMNGSGSTISESRADRDRRAGDDHRAAGVRHRLDERRLDVLALAQLVAEAEDHQQRVVDRDAEADERDQELDDDRDVGDVGQAPRRA